VFLIHVPALRAGQDVNVMTPAHDATATSSGFASGSEALGKRRSGGRGRHLPQHGAEKERFEQVTL
jgi:hypothetical protein